MSRLKTLAPMLAVAAFTAVLTAWLVDRPPPAESPGAVRPQVHAPDAPKVDAAQIASGRLPMERLPKEVGVALEAHTEQIIKTAELLEGKQARITGTCPPGAAIRVIAEDGTVSCQRLPRGMISVSALVATPMVSSTPTAAASVSGGVGRYQVGGADDFLVVPVALPDGAIVTSFTYFFYDASEEVDGSAYLYRSDDQPMAMVSSAGSALEVRQATTEHVALRKVDTQSYAYFVYFQTSGAVGASLMPVAASVGYRLP